MADTKITSLATGTTLHSDDWLVYVDTHDASMASSGTDKKLSPAVLMAGLSPFVASGSSHAAGLVTDPGASAGNTKYLREDATWAVPVGGGGGGSPGGTNGQIQYNNSSAFAGAADWAIGAGGELVATAISDPGTPAAGALWLPSTQKVLSGVSAGVVWRGGGVIWQQQTAGTAVSNTTSQTSLLTGGTAVGSLTIPANAWTPGKILRIRAFGTFATTGTPTLSIIPSINGHNICTSGALTQATVTGKHWQADAWVMCQSIGASGTFIGTVVAQFQAGSTTLAPITGLGGGSSSGGVSSLITNDTTASNAIDLLATWGTASSSNTINVVAVTISLEG